MYSSRDFEDDRYGHRRLRRHCQHSDDDVPFTVYMSPAMKDARDRSRQRCQEERVLFQRQCPIRILRTDRESMMLSIRVPNRLSIHNLSIQIREQKIQTKKETNTYPQRIFAEKWRFVFVSFRVSLSSFSNDRFPTRTYIHK